MENTMNFTQEELQLIYAACMSYGDKLAEIKKTIPNEDEIIFDRLAVGRRIEGDANSRLFFWPLSH